MKSSRREIRTLDLIGILWRAFLIQASWSFDRMQTLGFAFALRPVLKRLYPDREDFLARLNLHMEYFNTQPYLASFILGAVSRLEQERALARNPDADVPGLKTALMGPLGALGDSFFWGALKPLASLSAAAMLMAGAWWAPILFLFLYNIWHLRIRVGSLFLGFRTAGDPGAFMARYKFTMTARMFKAVSLSLSGAVLGMSAMWREEFRLSHVMPDYLIVGACLLITLTLVAILRRAGSPIRLMLGLAAVSLALAYLGAV